MKGQSQRKVHHTTVMKVIFLISSYWSQVFCAPKLQDQIKKICQNIVNHFEEVEHKKITRMVLYFKVSKKGQLYLLWSSSIRVASNHVRFNSIINNIF